jgi:hypothetical protein
MTARPKLMRFKSLKARLEFAAVTRGKICLDVIRESGKIT